MQPTRVWSVAIALAGIALGTSGQVPALAQSAAAPALLPRRRRRKPR